MVVVVKGKEESYLAQVWNQSYTNLHDSITGELGEYCKRIYSVRSATLYMDCPSQASPIWAYQTIDTSRSSCVKVIDKGISQRICL